MEEKKATRQSWEILARYMTTLLRAKHYIEAAFVHATIGHVSLFAETAYQNIEYDRNVGIRPFKAPECESGI